MSIEQGPIQIDLSKPLEKQGIQLSKTELQAFQDFLDLRKDNERQVVISMSQEELAQLKSGLYVITEFEDNGPLIELMNKQKKEGIGTEDLLSYVDSIPDTLGEKLDTSSYEALFGDNGILTPLKLSESSKDNITTSLSLSILKNIPEIANLTEDELTEKFTQILGRFTVLQQLATMREQGDKLVGGMDSPILYVAGNGDKNAIFQDVQIGTRFFDALISGKFETQDNIQTYIQNRNLPNGSETKITNNLLGPIVDLKNLTKIQKPDLEKATKAANEALTGATGRENDTSNIEKLKEKGGIYAIVATILEALQGFAEVIQDTSNGKTDTVSGEGEDKKQDEKGTEDKDKKENGFKNSDFILKKLGIDKKFEGVTKDQLQQMQDAIQSIDPTKTIDEIEQELYGENPEKGNFLKAITIFREHGFLNPIPTNKSGFDISLEAMREYARYKNSPGVKGKSDNRTPWEEWAKEQNWNSGSVE